MLTAFVLHPPQQPCLTGFQFTQVSRGHSYDNMHPQAQHLRQNSHGRVGIYHSVTKDVLVVIWPTKCYNVKCLIFQVKSINLTAAVIYRPASYPAAIFCQHLKQLIDLIDRCPGIKSSWETLMKMHWITVSFCLYTQYVQTAPTDKGTLIDHVYMKDCANILVNVLPVYYSYHEMVRIAVL